MRREWEMWEEEGEILRYPHKPAYQPWGSHLEPVKAEQPERTVKGRSRKKFKLTLSGFGEAAEVVENRCGENLSITQVTIGARGKGRFDVRLSGMDMVRADIGEGVEVWNWKGFHNKSKAWWGPDNLLQVAAAGEVESITVSGDVL